MKNYNEIYDAKQMMCHMMDTAYSKGYDKAYNDRKIEEEFDEDRKKAIEDAYQKGLDDAWECAKWISLPPKDGGMDYDTLLDIFGVNTWVKVFVSHSASEAIAKTEGYGKKKKADDEIEVCDEIEVGDEVKLIDNVVGVVTHVYERSMSDLENSKTLDVIMANGKCSMTESAYVEKTGRHFAIIQDIFEQMKVSDSDDN